MFITYIRLGYDSLYWVSASQLQAQQGSDFTQVLDKEKSLIFSYFPFTCFDLYFLLQTSFPVPRAPPPPGTSTSSSPSSSSSGGTSSPSSKSRGVVAASPRHGKRPPSQLSHCPASPVTSHMSSHCPGSPAQAQQLSSMRGPASPVISVQMSRGSPASPASMLSRGQPVHGSQLLYSHGKEINQ